MKFVIVQLQGSQTVPATRKPFKPRDSSIPKHVMIARSLNNVDEDQCVQVQVVNVSDVPIDQVPLGT